MQPATRRVFLCLRRKMIKGKNLRAIIQSDSVVSDKPQMDRVDDTHCIECGNPLSESDIELGYECEHCRRQWMCDVTGEPIYL